MAAPHIELIDVRKSFGAHITALDGVTLQIERGEIVAILGPSGSGKSTLMRCINGLETPTAGVCLVNGVEVGPRSLGQVRREVGMVFQRFNLVPRTSVMSNVLVGRLGYRNWLTNLLGWFPSEDYDRAFRALNEVRLLDRAWDRADRLSGGQQQRVGIARTLVQQANAILADEPVASLDPETSLEIMRLLVNVTQEHGATLVVNLHQVALAQAFAHRIIGLKAGQIVFDLPAEAVGTRELRGLYLGEKSESIGFEREAIVS